jgi:hypothetical protein
MIARTRRHTFYAQRAPLVPQAIDQIGFSRNGSGRSVSLGRIPEMWDVTSVSSQGFAAGCQGFLCRLLDSGQNRLREHAIARQIQRRLGFLCVSGLARPGKSWLRAKLMQSVVRPPGWCVSLQLNRPAGAAGQQVCVRHMVAGLGAAHRRSFACRG